MYKINFIHFQYQWSFEIRSISTEEEEEKKTPVGKDNNIERGVNGIFEEDILDDAEILNNSSEMSSSALASDNKVLSDSEQSTGLLSSHTTTQSTPRKTSNPNELVAQGVSFLSGLAETLKSPEATQQLVDSIVQKDATTGETSIKIPVESKETVSNLFGLIGKLLSTF